MARSIRVAAIQLAAHDRAGFPDALDAIVTRIESAARDADLIVLPEATFPAYVLGDADIDAAAVGAAVGRLQAIAARASVAIVAGCALRSDGGLRNAALVIDRDGSLAGQADKLFLWHFDHRWFVAGEQVTPIQTKLGCLGVLVCADGRLPTIARALVDRGAEILIMPTAWVTSGRDPSALENVQADLLARVRAYENAVPFVAANKCGAERGIVAYCGKSQIVDASGEIVAIASERQPETIRATLALAQPKPHRTSLIEPSPRSAASEKPMRIAITVDPLPRDIEGLLDILDDAFVAAPDAASLAALDRALPIASVSDAVFLDPAGLVAYRRAGYRLIVWETRHPSPWAQRLARARALELRLYVVVLDRTQERAFAVDPDGAIVAGTFNGLRLASFLLDPRKMNQTTLVPGTDIAAGLERVADILRRQKTIEA